MGFNFQNVVAIVMILVRWGIPDMSGDLRDQIRREAYITNEIIIKQEAIRARLGEWSNCVFWIEDFPDKLLYYFSFYPYIFEPDRD